MLQVIILAGSLCVFPFIVSYSLKKFYRYALDESIKEYNRVGHQLNSIYEKERVDMNIEYIEK